MKSLLGWQVRLPIVTSPSTQFKCLMELLDTEMSAPQAGFTGLQTPALSPLASRKGFHQGFCDLIQEKSEHDRRFELCSDCRLSSSSSSCNSRSVFPNTSGNQIKTLEKDMALPSGLNLPFAVQRCLRFTCIVRHLPSRVRLVRAISSVFVFSHFSFVSTACAGHRSI